MKKKIFTLLTLLLCVCGGAWADDVSVTWLNSSMTEISSGGTASVDNILIVNDLAITSTLSGPTLKSANNTNWGAFNTTTKDAGKNNASPKDCISFSVKVKDGFTFEPTKISATVGGDGTGDNGALLTTTTITQNTSAKINKASDGGSELTITPSVSTINSGDTFTFYIYIGSRANTNPIKGVCVKDVKLEGTYLSASAPMFSSNVEAMTLAVNPISTSKSAKFTLSGKNLTNGTYNLTVPMVEGLSVSPTSFTVDNGTCSQEFTVTYTSTADVAEAVANITATVDGITSTVAVTYSSIANLYTQTAITGATTWDWSKYGVKEINTSGTAFNRTDILVANVAFYGFDAPANDFGPAQSLTLSGDYIVRDTKYCQVTSAKFTTTVPGMLKVVFSNTGGNRPYRYLYVNGKDTGIGSNSGTMVTASNIYVPAGDVELTAILDPTSTDEGAGQPNFMRISLIEFSTLPANTTVKIDNGTGYRTFASKYPTDWSAVNGVTAYTASVNSGTVTFTKVTGAVPAGEGLLLKADDATVTDAYNVPIPTATPAVVTNALVGVITSTEVPAGSFVLMAGTATNQGTGFYKTTNTFTVGANTAYLPANVASARNFIGFNEDETTGIADVRSKMEDVKASECYDLQGRRVAQPQKGLYIMNGKKVIIK